jgi:hypothetical protein
MLIIRQGKTNWKFLLIIIIVAVIVGGGIFVYQRRIIKETMAPMSLELPKEEIVQPEKEELPKEVISEYEIFTREIAYKGTILQPGRLPIRTLFIPEGTEIARIEGYLEALNADTTNTREVGIAVGSEIPANCRAKYYLDISPSGDQRKDLVLETNLLQPGTNQITVWISSEGEWGGEISWISLKLKIYYKGEAPKLSETINILKGPIDPIECKLLKIYVNEQYKYEIKYPEDWLIYESDGTFVSFSPIGKEIPIEYAGDVIIEVVRLNRDDVQRLVDREIERGSFLYKREISAGSGNYEGIQVLAVGISKLHIIYFSRGEFTYKISMNIESLQMPTINRILSSFKFLD